MHLFIEVFYTLITALSVFYNNLILHKENTLNKILSTMSLSNCKNPELIFLQKNLTSWPWLL